MDSMGKRGIAILLSGYLLAGASKLSASAFLLSEAYAEVDCLTGRYTGIVYRDEMFWKRWLWPNPVMLYYFYAHGYLRFGKCLYADSGSGITLRSEFGQGYFGWDFA
jgi:hypothetical protein